jgi:hypothetical protein
LPEGDVEYKAERIFFNIHEINLENILMSELSFKPFNLMEWLNLSGIDMTGYFKSGPRNFSVKYKTPKRINIKLNDIVQITFSVGLENILIKKPQTDFTFDQAGFVSISFIKEKMRFVDFLNYKNKIVNFLSFCIDYRIYPDILKFVYEENNSRAIIEVLEPPYSNKPHEIKHEYSMNFSYHSIKPNFAKVFKNWFKFYEKLESIIELYLNYITEKNATVENQFLNLTQAIEKFHRVTEDGLYLSEEDYTNNVYNKIVQVIPKEISIGLKDALKSRLKYGNEKSLRNRIRDLLEKYTQFKYIMVFDEDKFIKSIVDTRNYLTHYEKEEKNFIEEGLELRILRLKLFYFLKYLLNTKIGISDKIKNSNLIRDRDSLAYFSYKNKPKK